MIDIGANLTNESFRTDLEMVLQRARQHGVEQIIVTGTDIAHAESARALAKKHPGFLYSTAGLHPHHASQFTAATLDSFSRLLQDDAVVAIGETGLDYNRNFSSQPDQRSAFAAHLELAEQIKKPLFLHERDAYRDFHPMMQSHPALCERAIVHCFTGDLQSLKSYLDLGLHIGITGWICDKKRGANLREIVRFAPLDRLMIETDAPYLTPHKETVQQELAHKHRNEPWTLHYTARALAEAQNIEEEKVRTVTRATARRFFGLD